MNIFFESKHREIYRLRLLFRRKVRTRDNAALVFCFHGTRLAKFFLPPVEGSQASGDTRGDQQWRGRTPSGVVPAPTLLFHPQVSHQAGRRLEAAH